MPSHDFHHFTSTAAADQIRIDGHVRPSFVQIPLVGRSAQSFVSLTVDPDPRPLIGYTLCDGRALSGPLLEQYLTDHPGAVAPIFLPHTSAEVLTFEIPDTDMNLFTVDYASLSALGFTSEENVETFIRLGGGQPGYWFAYFGGLPLTYLKDRRSTGY